MQEAGWFWAGTPTGAWERDREFYRSFPESVAGEGKNRYVDVIVFGSWDRVVLGRYIVDRIGIWPVYDERLQGNLNWKDIVHRVEGSVQFLP
jgi:hypothetical protein